MKEKIKIEDLLAYEMYSISEWVSIGWMQTILARLLAWKVNRKIARYNKRLAREDWIKRNMFKYKI